MTRKRKQRAASPSTLATPPSTTFWLIRHGEIEKRYQNVFGGRLDMKLSARGHRQADALAEFLHGKQFDAVYASPMRRVQQTLAPLLRNSLPPPVVLPELREVDFGDWTGLGWEEVERKFGHSAFGWLDQLEQAAIPGGESARQFRDRLEPVVRGWLARHPGQNVAVVCHGGVIRMVLAILLDWPLPKMAAFEIEYASVTQVVVSPTRTRLHLVNFTPWRDGKVQSPKSKVQSPRSAVETPVSSLKSRVSTRGAGRR
jgi:broad specificity phosphatase PhoE